MRQEAVLGLSGTPPEGPGGPAPPGWRFVTRGALYRRKRRQVAFGARPRPCGATPAPRPATRERPCFVPPWSSSRKVEELESGTGARLRRNAPSTAGLRLYAGVQRTTRCGVEPTEAGDYRLCFDNSFSTISEKLVFFELIFDSFQDEEEVEGWAEAVEPEEMLDVKMEDIKESIETMRTRLERSIQMLTLLRAFEARDRNLQEDNLERVNFWSAANVAVLLLVAVLQVCTLKRFFHDKRPVPM